MSITLGAVANVFNEVNALPGWLENVTSFADHVAVYHSGPGGRWSDDGTMEVLQKWKIPVHRGTIDDGFGVARTATLRCSPCDWVMLLDADERFYSFVPTMRCSGENTPPDVEGQVLYEYDRGVQGDGVPSNWENLHLLGKNLEVTFTGDAYNQLAWLKGDLAHHTKANAYTMIRRHWHDFSWKRPTQNWHLRPDFQNRLVRNLESVRFDPNTRMHERLLGADNRISPNQTHGPFIDHYHLAFKRMAPADRRFKVGVYDAIDRGEKPTVRDPADYDPLPNFQG